MFLFRDCVFKRNFKGNIFKAKPKEGICLRHYLDLQCSDCNWSFYRWRFLVKNQRLRLNLVEVSKHKSHARCPRVCYMDLRTSNMRKKTKPMYHIWSITLEERKRLLIANLVHTPIFLHSPKRCTSCSKLLQNEDEIYRCSECNIYMYIFYEIFIRLNRKTALSIVYVDFF